MFSLLRKSAASMAKTGGSSPADDRFEAFDDDLSAWEFVNASLSDDEDVYSFDGDDVVSEEYGVTFDESAPKLELVGEEDDEDARASRDFEVSEVVHAIRYLPVVSPQTDFTVEMTREFVEPEVIHPVTCLPVLPWTTDPVEMTRDRDGDACDENDDDDDDDEPDVDDYDFDDELVPWKLKHILGKQRIRKMGKRGGPKLSKSKKLPYNRNRPGCLYGKHGFGVQHSFI